MKNKIKKLFHYDEIFLNIVLEKMRKKDDEFEE